MQNNSNLLDTYHKYKEIYSQIYPEYQNYIKIKNQLENEILQLSKNTVSWFEILKLKFNKSPNDYNKEYSYFFEDFGISGNPDYMGLHNDILNIKKSVKKIINSLPAHFKKYKKELIDQFSEISEDIENSKIELLDKINNINYNFDVFNRIKGKFAKFKFQQFLDENQKAFFVIDDNTETMPEIFRNNNSKSKRPDFFIALDNKFIIGIDIKNYRFKLNSSKDTCFGIQKTDVDLYEKLASYFPIPVFIAISNGNLYFKKWYFISVKNLIEKINNKSVQCEMHEKTSYNIPLNDFTSIFNNEFQDRDIIVKNKEELIEPVKKFLNESIEKNIL